MLASGNAARISQKYGCAQDIHNTGTYTMQGSTIIAAGQGLYKGKRGKLRCAANGQYGRPTIYLAYLDDNGNAIGGLECTYDGPPAP